MSRNIFFPTERRPVYGAGPRGQRAWPESIPLGRQLMRDGSPRGARLGVAYAPIVQRAAAIIGSAIFLVIAPGTLAVYVPWYLTHWHFAPLLFPIARVLGAALVVAGLPILLDSFARFALQGLGTPAPVMPPKRLVVTGFYRYVRNPIYVAVTALIAGQGLLFGSVTVLEYGAIVWAGSSCSLSPTKSLRWASSSPTSTSATART